MNRHENVLLEFLEDWYDWATSGKLRRIIRAIKSKPSYSGGNGLCSSTLEFSHKRSDWFFLQNTLRESLEKDFGLGFSIFPFNQDSQHYYLETSMELAHKSPERLAWVENKIAELRS